MFSKMSVEKINWMDGWMDGSNWGNKPKVTITVV